MRKLWNKTRMPYKVIIGYLGFCLFWAIMGNAGRGPAKILEEFVDIAAVSALFGVFFGFPLWAPLLIWYFLRSTKRKEGQRMQPYRSTSEELRNKCLALSYENPHYDPDTIHQLGVAVIDTLIHEDRTALRPILAHPSLERAFPRKLSGKLERISYGRVDEEAGLVVILAELRAPKKWTTSESGWEYGYSSLESVWIVFRLKEGWRLEAVDLGSMGERWIATAEVDVERLLEERYVQGELEANELETAYERFLKKNSPSNN